MGLKVIIADDDREVADTLAGVLREAGHDVHAVYAGNEVLPTARFVRPDAVIVDIVVPGMSGYAVAQELRHSFTEAKRPLLIAISGMWTERSDLRVAQQMGFDHYLAKPCDADEILSLLEPLTPP
ncbi:MAG TPA: response regulator [Burkholderiales bacterium]|nr:response regulator [Burkholderiales bacterium]